MHKPNPSWQFDPDDFHVKNMLSTRKPATDYAGSDNVVHWHLWFKNLPGRFVKRFHAGGGCASTVNIMFWEVVYNAGNRRNVAIACRIPSVDLYPSGAASGWLGRPQPGGLVPR